MDGIPLRVSKVNVSNKLPLGRSNVSWRDYVWEDIWNRVGKYTHTHAHARVRAHACTHTRGALMRRWRRMNEALLYDNSS